MDVELDLEALAQSDSTDADSSRDNEAKPSVLIVDDEPMILRSLRRLLHHEPYELTTAGSGKEAMELFESQTFDVVVSDNRMCDMTGVELLAEVREKWPDTVRIILSGYSEVSSILASVNDGEVFRFLIKPWNDVELKDHIARAVEVACLKKENRQLTEQVIEQNKDLAELSRQLQCTADDAWRGYNTCENIIEQLPVGVVLVDPEGMVVRVNSAACSLLDSLSVQAIGLAVRDKLPEPIWEALDQTKASSTLTAASGRVELDGCSLEWRTHLLGDAEGLRGQAVILWREVAA